MSIPYGYGSLHMYIADCEKYELFSKCQFPMGMVHLPGRYGNTHNKLRVPCVNSLWVWFTAATTVRQIYDTTFSSQKPPKFLVSTALTRTIRNPQNLAPGA